MFEIYWEDDQAYVVCASCAALFAKHRSAPPSWQRFAESEAFHRALEAGELHCELCGPAYALAEPSHEPTARSRPLGAGVAGSINGRSV